MEQNYRQEDPNVSDLRRAMIIRGALLDGFHMETRPNGTLAFVKHDANKKMVYIDVPTSNMPVSIYAANMQKIGEVYNARAENFEKMHPDVKLPRMQTDFEIIQGILNAVRYGRKTKLHIPGFDGNIGGYPVVIDGTESEPKVYIDESKFSLDETGIISFFCSLFSL